MKVESLAIDQTPLPTVYKHSYGTVRVSRRQYTVDSEDPAEQRSRPTNYQAVLFLWEFTHWTQAADDETAVSPRDVTSGKRDKSMASVKVRPYEATENNSVLTRESSYCFQRVLAIAILSVRLSHGRSAENGAS